MRPLLIALACAVALCAPSATSARQTAGVPIATRCAGSVIVKVAGTRIRASSIRATKVYCATITGKLVRWRESRLLTGKPPR